MILCKNLSKQYRSTIALQNINLHIDSEKIIGLVGRQGAGKSTLLKLITGQLKPTSGELTVFGQAPFDNLFVSTNSMLINREMGLPEVLTLKELMQISESFYFNWDKTLAKQLLIDFHLGEDDFYGKLSEEKRLLFHILLGISSNVKLTAFDDSMFDIGKSLRKELYNFIKQVQIRNPRIFILASQQLGELNLLVDELIEVEHGRLISS